MACPNNYCISNYSAVSWNDTYTITSSSYDGKIYYTGKTNGYFIFYNSANTEWCLSTTLGGSCELTGSVLPNTPISNSSCPNIEPLNIFKGGVCRYEPEPPSINECYPIFTFGKLTVTCATTNPTSPCAQDGSITVTASGGISPYTYYWKYNGNTVPDSSNTKNSLGKGVYECTVVDFYGEFSAKTVCTLVEPQCILVASITPNNTPVNCSITGNSYTY